MRSRQISRGHEEFVNDLTASEDECLFEKLCPLFLRERMMTIQPFAERSMFLLQLKNPLRIDDGRVDLESISDNARIIEQSCHIPLTILCHPGDIETVIGLAKVIGFLQDRNPGKPCLIDLKDKTFKEQVIILQRKSVFGVMVCPIKCVFGMGKAIIAIAGQCGLQIRI